MGKSFYLLGRGGLFLAVARGQRVPAVHQTRMLNNLASLFFWLFLVL